MRNVTHRYTVRKDETSRHFPWEIYDRRHDMVISARRTKASAWELAREWNREEARKPKLVLVNEFYLKTPARSQLRLVEVAC